MRQNATFLDAEDDKRVYWHMSPNIWNLQPWNARRLPMVTTTHPLLRQVMTDSAVDTTLSLVATMVGESRDTVAKIVAAGLPLMADAADGDPWVFKAMYAWSVKLVPEPTPASFAKLGKNAAAREAMVADFELVYGDYAEAIPRDAGVLAGATGALSRKVLAATMPAAVKALGKANTNANEMGFGRQLRNLTSATLSAGSTKGNGHGGSAPAAPCERFPSELAAPVNPPGPATPRGHGARGLDVLEASLHQPPLMTPAQARETIDRLSEHTAPLRRHEAAPDAMIAEFNGALTAFVPRSKMSFFFIGKGRYVGDTTRPGAFVAAGLLRHLIEIARTDFDALLTERQQQTPSR